MWKPYLKVIAKKAGQAIHILDRFHIMSHLSKAIDAVRAQETRELKEEFQLFWSYTSPYWAGRFLANNIIRLVAWLNLSLSLLCEGVIRIPGQLRTNTQGPCSHVQHERPAFTVQQAYRSCRLRRAIACWFH